MKTLAEQAKIIETKLTAKPAGLYDRVKSQISPDYGKFAIECPQCKKDAHANVGRPRNMHLKPGTFFVRTVCLHCHGSVTFLFERRGC